ncbi:MAG: PAS domain S-box protein, partial [Candidatus Izemoplasmatales bacterium]|nr:PAS domain S-box protein [Candidatus Izemoplasmatales bacterium]
ERLAASFCRDLKNIMERESADSSRKYENTLKLILSTACDGTWEWEPGSGRLSIDQRAAWMLGRVKGRAMPDELKWEDIVPGREAELFFSAIKSHMDKKTKFFDYLFTVENLDRHSFILIRGTSQRTKDTVSRLVGSFEDITEKMKYYEFREDANFRQLLMNSLPTPIAYKNADGIFDGCNCAFELMTGKGRSEIIGLRDSDVFAPEVAELHEKEEARLFEAGGIKAIELSFSVPDEGLRHFLEVKSVFYSADGQKAGIISSWTDITERKEKEQELVKESRKLEKTISEKNSELFATVVNLRQEIKLRFKTQEELLKSEKKFRTIAETSPVALIIIRLRDGCVLFSNPQAAALFNVKDPDSQSFFKFIPNQKERKKIVRKLRQFRHLDNHEMILNRMSGGTFPAAVSMQLGIYENEEAVFAGITDVTEQKTIAKNLAMAISEFEEEILARKKVEKALKESEKRYKMLSESIQVGIWQLDPKGIVKYINPKMAEMLELKDPDEIIGKSFASYVPEESIKMVNFGSFDQQPGAFFSSYEAELLGDRGTRRNVISTGIGLFSEKGKFKYYIETFTDITDRKNSEKEAERHRQQLIQADKMASLGILVASVAHEINNPTNFITLNAPIIKEAWLSIRPVTEEYFEQNGDFSVAGLRYSEMRDRLMQLIDGMIDGADRICGIINALKDYARQEPDSNMNEKVDLNVSVKKSLALLANMIRKSTLKLEVVYCSENLCTLGSRQRIEQVIVNLVQNACQALSGPEKAIRISVGPENGMAMIKVEDEGVGIPETNMPHLLDPFFTTKRDIGGTGLGLAITAGIIKEHAGDIQIDSREGQGTTVKVFLPVYEENIDNIKR